jgi:hypothetical protein
VPLKLVRQPVTSPDHRVVVHTHHALIVLSGRGT